ncbi:MAG: isochorismatase [Deltaproteobacteria bacterium]|nr:isochorismatase [Deltaproteobacteria bacterium]
MAVNELPIPSFFNADRVGEVWRVPYQERANDAVKWQKQNGIRTSAQDSFRVCLMLIDVQNTFCIPGFELYVGGATGNGAVDDNRRLGVFIYRNMPAITQICPTMDTHQVMQIFHSIFLVNKTGDHPEPYTLVSLDDIEKGVWRFNRKLAESLEIDERFGQAHLEHYARQLKNGGKYDLTIWPYHAMLGGIGHALVSTLEEAIFFHAMCRFSQPDFQLKGGHPLTENYSVLRPEIIVGLENRELAGVNQPLMDKLLAFDAVIIAGQAKSHCVLWTVADLLAEIENKDPALASKVYLLEDCTSPVVIPDVIDYTHPAQQAFQRFAEAGMHIVKSTDPMGTWPGFPS